jgi:TPP-dependent pyruvate/acetoin dehydrogenase alpha subunit
MEPDLLSLYKRMIRSRLFEVAVKQLWDEGAISGEMHLGLGEEAIVAGVIDHMIDGDAMALDHRGTPPMLMRGVDPVLLLREFLGRPDGLCRGMGGHMHLFSRQHLAASSGIVGASGPAAVGFALAGQQLRPGTLAIAFFGEGAINEGMLMEAMNLAVAWKLPVLFVCKDNDWAIFTKSSETTGADPGERARGFGMDVMEVDGSDVEAVWSAAREAVARARSGLGPTFVHASCTHFEGHFLGDALLRRARQPIGKEMRGDAWELVKSFLSLKGAPLRQRLASVKSTTSMIDRAKEQNSLERDPIEVTRRKLANEDAAKIVEEQVAQEVQQVVETALSQADEGVGS